MGVIAIHSDQEASDPSDQKSSASDGGVCRDDGATSTRTLGLTKQFDPKENPELGMAVGLVLLDIYANPDPAQKQLIVTPGNQKIWVYAQTISCSESERIESSKLLNDTLINGAWFLGKEKVNFHDDLAFASGMLRDDFEAFPGIWMKGRTEATYADDETLQDKSHFESGILRDPEKFYGIDFPAGTHATFYPSGKFRKVLLPDDQEINHIWFAKNHDIEFDEKGNVIRGTLLAPRIFCGLTWSASSEVEFHPEAGTKFKAGTLLEDIPWAVGKDEIILRGTCRVEFYANGSIKSGILRDPVTINGIDFAAGPISFYENGRVEKAILGNDISFPWIKFAVTFVKGCEVEFDENGRFHGGDPKYDVVLKDYLDDAGKPIVIKANGWLSVYPDGTFRNGRLKNEAVVEGLPLAQGSKIKFDEEKNFKTGILARDTSIFDDIYNGTVVFAEDAECGYNDKDEFYGTLKYDVSFDVQLPNKKITLTAQAGQQLRFNRDSERIQGGYLKSEVTPWPGVTFSEGDWFEIDLNHSDYFSPDPDKEEADYIGGILKNGISTDGHELPKEKYCEFYIDGTVKGYKVEDAFEVDSELYPDLILGGDRWVEFYPGGTNIRGGKLAEDVEPFSDIYDDSDNPFIFAQDAWVEFDENGILTGGKLAQDFVMEHPVFGDIFLKQGEWVDVTSEGAILGGRLADDTELPLSDFDNLVLAGGEWVDFDEDGNCVGGKLAEDATYFHPLYGAIKLKAGTRIEFNPDGTLLGGILATKLAIQNSHYGSIQLMADEWFELYPTGEFKSGTLKDELYIINNQAGNFFIVDGQEATFFPMETLQYGVLADTVSLNTVVGQLEFEEYSEIELAEDENILSGYISKKYTIGGDKYRLGEWVDLERYWPE